MKAGIHGPKDVAAVELSDREEIERGGEETYPGSAADRMKQKRGWRHARMKYGGEETKEERSAEYQLDVRKVGDAGNDFRVQNAEDESRDGEDKSDERAGSADIEESTGGFHRGADEDEGAESAGERREGDEERITGMDVMMTAGEEMAKLVG